MSTTTTSTTTDRTGAQLVVARNLLAELDDLNQRQVAWMQQQDAIACAIDLLEQRGFTVRPHYTWCWSASPHAARICQLENALGV